MDLALDIPPLETPTLEQIQALEAAMREMPQLPIETRHYFPDALYAREITAPAGALLVGKQHRTDHLNVLSKGSLLVWTEFGAKKLTAPCTFVAPAGTKRVGYVLEEIVWTTIHGNPDNQNSLDVLEQRLICPETPTITRPAKNLEIQSSPAGG